MSVILLGGQRTIDTPIIWVVGQYWLSSSVALGNSLHKTSKSATTLVALSASIFLFNRAFSFLSASISSTFLFLYSASFCCIFIYALRIRETSYEGLASIISVTPIPLTPATLLSVDTISISLFFDNNAS